jgi:tryptophan-rich sensory protein
MAGKTAIDELGWLIVLILTIFFDPIVQGINRILRGKLIIGIVWIITGGVFGIGWIVDIITMLIHKDITVLA